MCCLLLCIRPWVFTASVDYCIQSSQQTHEADAVLSVFYLCVSCPWTRWVASPRVESCRQCGELSAVSLIAEIFLFLFLPLCPKNWTQGFVYPRWTLGHWAMPGSEFLIWRACYAHWSSQNSRGWRQEDQWKSRAGLAYVVVSSPAKKQTQMFTIRV